MAVQAALLSSHPFIPFGFGGSADGLVSTFGSLDKGCCFEDDESGAPAGALLSGSEGGDVREATRDLLSFIDSASSNIKLALDKPGKSKRKVNHRKYLQKQIKRCSGLMGTAPPGPPSPSAGDAPAKRPPGAPGAPTVAAPAHCKATARREATQAAAAASLQSRSLAALFDSLHQVPGGSETAGGAVAVPVPGLGTASVGGDGAGTAGSSAAPGTRKVPLRARNLPPSFFTEPSRVVGSSSGCGGGPSGQGMSLGDLEKGADAVEFFELLAPDFGACNDSGVLLAAEPLDAFPAGATVLRGPLELESGPFETPAMVGNLLYPEPWSAPSCPQTKKPPLAGVRGGVTLNEPVRLLYPTALDSPGGEDAPTLASFAPFFPDCSLPPPPHQVSYDYSAGYSRAVYPSLWRPDGVWEGASGEEGLHPD
ncbi:hypothetical protein HispidOSU_025707 [Sigmodon hispidus]